ncbi:unnamed protein product, partial [Prorocentrum cordatum]
MAKKGTYNGPFFSSFATRIRGTPIRFGVLIGTELDEDGQRDALFAAATPPQPGEDGEPVEAPKDVGALLRSSAGDLPFAEWATQHMEAVRKMLPGGLEPCGCFAVAAEAAAKDLAPHLVPVLKGIKDPLVLTIDPAAPKLCFWQHAGGAKPALRPAQVKADSHREPLLVWASWALDLVLPRAAGAEVFNFLHGPDEVDGADEGKAATDTGTIAEHLAGHCSTVFRDKPVDEARRNLGPLNAHVLWEVGRQHEAGMIPGDAAHGAFNEAPLRGGAPQRLLVGGQTGVQPLAKALAARAGALPEGGALALETALAGSERALRSRVARMAQAVALAHHWETFPREPLRPARPFLCAAALRIGEGGEAEALRIE